MRILMLGNSFTFYHDMPKILAQLLEAEVVAHTRGGASLREHLNPETTMGAKTLRALQEGTWDYVVLQEQSFGPIRHKESFLASVRELCPLIRQSGAKPLLYSTWAYQEGSEKLASTGLSFEEMTRGLQESYRQAAAENDALVAEVGEVFARIAPILNLYSEKDHYHPSEAGSVLIADTIARVIEKDRHRM